MSNIEAWLSAPPEIGERRPRAAPAADAQPIGKDRRCIAAKPDAVTPLTLQFGSSSSRSSTPQTKASCASLAEHDVDRPVFDTKMRCRRGGCDCSHCGLSKHDLVSIPKVAGKGD
ncbi:hypothetical protein ACVOMV_16990 [Mesorhizobium atlanticum]